MTLFNVATTSPAPRHCGGSQLGRVCSRAEDAQRARWRSNRRVCSPRSVRETQQVRDLHFHVLLSKEKGLGCLEAVGVWVMCSLSFSLKKHLLLERRWRGASDKESAQACSAPSLELPPAGRVSHAASACAVLLCFMKRRENVKFRMSQLFPED